MIDVARQLVRARQALHEAMPMTDAQWEVFQQGLQLRNYKKGELILRQGETESYLSMVLHGLTRHYVLTSRGEDKSFDFSFQHDFNCSYASFLTQSPSRFFIEALKPTLLASMPYSFLQQLYEAHPVSNKIGRIAMEQYYLWREAREVSLLVDSAEARYLRLLDQHPHYAHGLPLKYLASFLNVRPESLSRIRRRILLAEQQVS
jgi:CRP-like cAMP-binding protein